MIVSDKQLFNLPVETQSGDPLGHIIGMEIESDGQRIWRYHVVKGALVFKKEYLIAPSQVVSISKERMVVEDATIKDAIFQGKRQQRPDTSAA